MPKRVPADEVRLAADFLPQYRRLLQDPLLKTRIEHGLDALKENLLAGEQIAQGRWPTIYIRRYGIRNLFRMELGRRWRLLYTIVAEGGRRIVVVLEVLDHRTYDRRFGYG